MNWKRTLVTQDTSIRDVISVIDQGSNGIALVVNDENQLIGTITDGDVRRGILKGISIESNAGLIMNVNPIVAYEDDSKEALLALMNNYVVRQIPILSHDREVVRLETMEEIVRPSIKDNWVVLMAGGLGSRLQKLTQNCPKPLLKVGGRPLLETILLNLIEFGFHRFYISVNYKADMVEQHFGDGSKWNVEIRYLRENQRLGTAGALSLIDEPPSESILVMNGDLLTKVNFKQLLDFHNEHNSFATMCVRDYEYQVPYGVVKVNKHKLVGIEEKPIQHYFVNAGIYVLHPSVLQLIPSHSFYDMPSLFEETIKRGQETAVFPIREYWLDIGQIDDYNKANVEFDEVFG